VMPAWSLLVAWQSYVRRTWFMCAAHNFRPPLSARNRSVGPPGGHAPVGCIPTSGTHQPLAPCCCSFAMTSVTNREWFTGPFPSRPRCQPGRQLHGVQLIASRAMVRRPSHQSPTHAANSGEAHATRKRGLRISMRSQRPSEAAPHSFPAVWPAFQEMPTHATSVPLFPTR